MRSRPNCRIELARLGHRVVRGMGHPPLTRSLARSRVDLCAGPLGCDRRALWAVSGVNSTDGPDRDVEHALARLQWLIRGRPASFGRDEIERNRHISLLWREGIEHLIAQAGLQVAGKHFTGSARLGSGLLAWGKRAIVRLMEAVLPGELSGTTRLYVLTRGDRTPGKTGPGDVY